LATLYRQPKGMKSRYETLWQWDGLSPLLGILYLGLVWLNISNTNNGRRSNKI